MFAFWFSRFVDRFGRRYDYDVSYLHHLRRVDTGAFLRAGLLNLVSAHRGGVPAAPLFAARLRAALAEDCGPCVQLVANMAVEAAVDPAIVAGILRDDPGALPGEVALVLAFTEAVLARDPQADRLREDIAARWGERGVAAIALAIGTSRVYPCLKHALGYGRACSRVTIAEQSLLPVRRLVPEA